MKGDFFDTQADILDEAQGGTHLTLPFLTHTLPYQTHHTPTPILTRNAGLVVARIDRKLLSGKDIFFGQQTYGVQIAPGVDMALIAALCICLDEKNNEGS